MRTPTPDRGATDLSRVLLFTGKGGVGKTSVAAATAVRAAAAGRRVLVTSTDPAHSLADVLDRPVGDAPTALPVDGEGVLLAQQIDAQARLEAHWREVRDYLVALLSRGGLGRLEAEELVLLPGLDELFALLDLNARVASGEHDLVVVDCAPTGETLRLLGLPDALRWYVDRALGPGRRVARAVRPVVRGLGAEAGVVPEDEVFATVERVHGDLAAVHGLLQDPARTSVRLVTNAERVVVAETRRMATSLSLFGYAVDAVVVNRLLPDEVRDPYLDRWRGRQHEAVAEVRRDLEPTPVLTAPLLDGEPVGAGPLLELGRAVYGGLDEAALLHDEPPVVLEERDDDHVLRIRLPFVAEDDLQLHRRGDELHVRAGAAKRTIALPAVLRRDDVARARLADGWLELTFRAAVDEAAAP